MKGQNSKLSQRYTGKGKKHKVSQQSPQPPPVLYSAAQACYKAVSIKPNMKHETQQQTDETRKAFY
jgi:hypothetical protein